MSVVGFHVAKRKQAGPRERDILFAGPMVNAIRAGSKTQTRRTIDRLSGLGRITEFGPSDTPGFKWHFRDRRRRWQELHDDAELLALCPYGKVGDRLWVRETWAAYTTPGHEYPDDCDLLDDIAPRDMPEQYGTTRSDCVYRADGESFPPKWRSSLTMPRWASRLTLELTDVRFERLHDISEADAQAEGIAPDRATDHPRGVWYTAFMHLWNEINRRDAWSLNPYVWALTFRKVGES